MADSPYRPNRPYSEVAEECRDRCLYGECGAPGTFLGCGGCCGCLGPCVVTYEKSLPPAPVIDSGLGAFIETVENNPSQPTTESQT